MGGDGSITRTFAIEAEREIREAWTVSGRVGAAFEEEEDGDEEQTLQASIGSEWRLSRYLAIVGALSYETVETDDAADDYDVTTATLGIRIQR